MILNSNITDIKQRINICAAEASIITSKILQSDIT